MEAAGRLRAPDADRDERIAAGTLAVTNALSLAFDVVDAVGWVRGDRAVAGAD